MIPAGEGLLGSANRFSAGVARNPENGVQVHSALFKQKTAAVSRTAGVPGRGVVSGANGFLIATRLYLDLFRFAGFGNRDLDVENAVVQPAVHMVQIEAARQRDSSIELAVRQLRVPVLFEAFGSVAFTLDHQLVVLHAHPHILLRDAGDDGAEVQKVIIPARLKHGAEGPSPLTRTGRSGRLRLPVEVIKHLVDRAPKLTQRLSNIGGKQS